MLFGAHLVLAIAVMHRDSLLSNLSSLRALSNLFLLLRSRFTLFLSHHGHLLGLMFEHELLLLRLVLGKVLSRFTRSWLALGRNFTGCRLMLLCLSALARDQYLRHGLLLLCH